MNPDIFFFQHLWLLT